MTKTLALIAFFFLTSVGWVTGKDHDSAVLTASGIEPNADGIGTFLNSLGDQQSQIGIAEKLFAQLQSDDFKTRQSARLKLGAMLKVPDSALEKALASGDPETVVFAKKLRKAQQASEFGTELVAYACLRSIAAKKLQGLAQEILSAASHFKSPPTRKAAQAALAATLKPGEKNLIETAAAAGHEIAQSYFQQQGEKAVMPSWEEFFKAQLIHGKGEGGHQTDFLKPLPAKLAKCFDLRTEEANTMGSVDDRRRTSPWLYPEPNCGEIPKVLERNGKRLYPVLGSWKQHYSNFVLSLDQNGALIGGGTHSGEGGVHLKSTVDFILVPVAKSED